MMLAMEAGAVQAIQIVLPAVTAMTIFISGLIIYNSRKNRESIEKLALDVKMLQTQISPFWASLQTKVAEALHKPEPGNEALDALLEKLEDISLTPEEKLILELQLEALKDTASPDTAKKADLLLKIMPLVEAEAAGKLPKTDQRSIKAKKLAGKTGVPSNILPPFGVAELYLLGNIAAGVFDSGSSV